MAAYLATSVLVVDDSPTTIKVVRKLLARIGFKSIDDAANGLEALVKLSEKQFDLVIADWNMEPMSGFELLRQIRCDQRFAKIRVILMTAETRAEQVIAAKKTGAYYIGKPFSAEALREKIVGLFLASQHDWVPL
jgi:two-component system chemotaxis response regulator CheY